MPRVELTDATYRLAVEKAAAYGFASVDDYVADAVLREAAAAAGDFDHLFTPERLAHIDAGLADLAAGRTYTSAEVDAHLARLRAERVGSP